MDGPRFAIHVVHQQVLPQVVGRGEVRLAAAELRDFLDGLHRAVVAGEYERVNQDALGACRDQLNLAK